MPFDVAGNFTRSYNFVQDRDNGIKILAARVDGEFDNFATGMNAVFFRDGRVPMQADLRMNINRVTGLADGSVGSPALKFNTDASTGPYLDGLSRYAISVNGVQRAVFTTTGLDVAGTIKEGGSLLSAVYAPLASPALTGNPTAPTQLGSDNSTRIATTAYVQGLAYMPKAGGTFTGGVTAPMFTTAAGASNGIVITPQAGGGNTSQLYSPAANDLRIYQGGDQYTFTNGAFTMVPSTFWLNTNKMLLQHDGSNGYMRTQSGFGVLNLGANGNSTFQLGGNNVKLLTNNARLQFVDASGTSPSFINQSDNNFVFYGTNAAGADRGIWSVSMRSNTAPLNIAVPTSLADTLSVTGQTFMSNDMVINRNTVGSPTTGAIFFGNTGTKYFYYNGANFEINGALAVNGNITSSSDARLKSNVRDFGDARAMVAALQPKRFTMYGKDDFGLIAQDVQQIAPQIVQRDHKGMLSLDYGRLVTALIADNNALAARLERAGL